MKKLPIVLAAASLVLASAAFAAPPAKTGTTAKGAVLTDANGMTLYTFDKDAEGKSACNGPCATNWPVAMPIIVAQCSSRAGVHSRCARCAAGMCSGIVLYPPRRFERAWLATR